MDRILQQVHIQSSTLRHTLLPAALSWLRRRGVQMSQAIIFKLFRERKVLLPVEFCTRRLGEIGAIL